MLSKALLSGIVVFAVVYTAKALIYSSTTAGQGAWLTVFDGNVPDKAVKAGVIDSYEAYICRVNSIAGRFYSKYKYCAIASKSKRYKSGIFFEVLVDFQGVWTPFFDKSSFPNNSFAISYGVPSNAPIYYGRISYSSHTVPGPITDREIEIVYGTSAMKYSSNYEIFTSVPDHKVVGVNGNYTRYGFIGDYMTFKVKAKPSAEISLIFENGMAPVILKFGNRNFTEASMTFEANVNGFLSISEYRGFWIYRNGNTINLGVEGQLKPEYSFYAEEISRVYIVKLTSKEISYWYLSRNEILETQTLISSPTSAGQGSWMTIVGGKVPHKAVAAHNLLYICRANSIGGYVDSQEYCRIVANNTVYKQNKFIEVLVDFQGVWCPIFANSRLPNSSFAISYQAPNDAVFYGRTDNLKAGPIYNHTLHLPEWPIQKLTSNYEVLTSVPDHKVVGVNGNYTRYGFVGDYMTFRVKADPFAKISLQFEMGALPMILEFGNKSSKSTDTVYEANVNSFLNSTEFKGFWLYRNGSVLKLGVESQWKEVFSFDDDRLPYMRVIKFTSRERSELNLPRNEILEQHNSEIGSTEDLITSRTSAGQGSWMSIIDGKVPEKAFAVETGNNSVYVCRTNAIGGYFDSSKSCKVIFNDVVYDKKLFFEVLVDFQGVWVPYFVNSSSPPNNSFAINDQAILYGRSRTAGSNRTVSGPIYNGTLNLPESTIQRHTSNYEILTSVPCHKIIGPRNSSVHRFSGDYMSFRVKADPNEEIILTFESEKSKIFLKLGGSTTIPSVFNSNMTHFLNVSAYSGFWIFRNDKRVMFGAEGHIKEDFSMEISSVDSVRFSSEETSYWYLPEKGIPEEANDSNVNRHEWGIILYLCIFSLYV